MSLADIAIKCRSLSISTFIIYVKITPTLPKHTFCIVPFAKQKLTRMGDMVCYKFQDPNKDYKYCLYGYIELIVTGEIILPGNGSCRYSNAM